MIAVNESILRRTPASGTYRDDRPDERFARKPA